MVGAIRYRVGQFFRALGPQLPEIELQAAIQTLPLEAQALFRRQEPQDQRHALAVYEALRQEGHSDPDLLAAALLHDVGKAAAPCPPSVRAIAVLMGHFAPALLGHLTANWEAIRSGDLPGWRKSVAAHVNHADVGAHWAKAAGCSERTAALIRRHRQQLGSSYPSGDELLAALQAADSVN